MIVTAQIDSNRLSELSLEQFRELSRTLLVRTEHDSRESLARRQDRQAHLRHRAAQADEVRPQQQAAQRREARAFRRGGDRRETLQPTLPPKAEEEDKRPKRTPRPERLPSRDVHHELENTTCGIG
jgi:transposase